ncbi:DUF5681 domain-containing protein [Oceanibacterium hippocampi]|uniref:DUF5681 domain-containing protein n=1 Tax=Oceanibacterium hippocampi TaxID=745714 RepID=A0A1Y5TZH9_9PROT|nr:DUF5681 domain-containing protein [Oceanibacterium hippocampi]SLN72147.1 hypothetical protein OCH7691_03435 [Oceanibacterium hippocampi]
MTADGTGQGNRNLPALRPPPAADYEVGYGKPPAHSRFRKGQSGNPRGRPKGARNRLPAPQEEKLKEIILAESYRPITVRDGGREVTVPMAQAVMRAIAVKAAKGDHRSQRLFTEILSATEADRKRLSDELLQTAIEYKTGWEIEIDRCKALGIKPPEPLPHPDHVQIDFATGTVHFTGPITREDKAHYDKLAAMKAGLEDDLADIREELAKTKDPKIRKVAREEIRRLESMLARFRKVIPG